MEKAIKQRLLGGLVLVAGAALFLPMLLDGSGAALTVPPMPVAPKVPPVEAVAPALDAQVKQADAAVDAAHAAPADVATEPEGDVAPDAAAVTAEPARPVVDDSKRIAAEKAAQDKAAQDKAAQEKAAQDKATQQKAAQAAQLKAAQDKAAAQAKADAEKARLAAEARQEAAKQEAMKQEAAKKAAAKTTATKPVADSKPAAALPEAWVVQVASLSTKDKADALVQKLRQKNYRAVLHQQGSVWKVVIGPELRKEVAESIKSRLAADPDLKLSGWVQAYKP